MNKSLQNSFRKSPLPVLQTWFNPSVFVCRPIRYNGGNEDAEVKFACIVLAHYHKA